MCILFSQMAANIPGLVSASFVHANYVTQQQSSLDTPSKVCQGHEFSNAVTEVLPWKWMGSGNSREFPTRSEPELGS